MDAITAKLFIDEPPQVHWDGSFMVVRIKCGDLKFTRVMSRHAAVGLFMELRRELAASESEGGARAVAGSLAGAI